METATGPIPYYLLYAMAVDAYVPELNHSLI